MQGLSLSLGLGLGLGPPPVTIEDIKRVEGWAAGHSDYTFKFALYCAELSIGKSKHPDAM